MSWMPTAPTDNLYKFSALWGLRMLLGLLLFFAWLISIQMQIEKEMDSAQHYYRSAMILPDIEQRLDALKQGKVNEHRLAWALPHWTPQDERVILEIAAKRHRQSMAASKSIMDQKAGEALAYLRRLDVLLIGFIYIVLATGLFVFGFMRWKRKLHDVEGKLRDVELTMRELGIEKLRIEIAQLRRSGRRS